jgi:hypothetical protein
MAKGRLSQAAPKYDASKGAFKKRKRLEGLSAEEKIIRGLLAIAKQAMPDSYFASDRRVRRAKSWLSVAAMARAIKNGRAKDAAKSR